MPFVIHPYVRGLVLIGGFLLAVFLGSASADWEQAPSAVTGTPGPCVEKALRVYMDAGADGQWGTIADVLYSVTFFEYDDEGRLSTEVSVTDPGPDGLWGTDEDIIGKRTLYGYDDAGRQVRSVSFKGADDIEPVQYVEIKYDRFDRKQLEVVYGFSVTDDAGAPPLEERLWYSRHLYDSHGRERSIIFGNRDEMTDEMIHTQMVFHFDAEGNRVRMFNYQGAVTDPAALSSLPVIGWTEYEFDDSGRQIRAIDYVEPGFDGQWRTADDIIGSIIEYTYHVDGRPKSATSYKDRGPDEVWGTDDDVVQYRTVTVWSCDPEALPENTLSVTTPE